MYRVVRVLEYEYESAEAALEDMEKWAVPANGVAPFISRTDRSIHSATIGPLPTPPAEKTD